MGGEGLPARPSFDFAQDELNSTALEKLILSEVEG